MPTDASAEIIEIVKGLVQNRDAAWVQVRTLTQDLSIVTGKLQSKICDLAALQEQYRALQEYTLKLASDVAALKNENAALTLDVLSLRERIAAWERDASTAADEHARCTGSPYCNHDEYTFCPVHDNKGR